MWPGQVSLYHVSSIFFKKKNGQENNCLLQKVIGRTKQNASYKVLNIGGYLINTIFLVTFIWYNYYAFPKQKPKERSHSNELTYTLGGSGQTLK